MTPSTSSSSLSNPLWHHNLDIPPPSHSRATASSQCPCSPYHKGFMHLSLHLALNSTKQYLIDLTGRFVWGPCPTNYGLVHCTAPICTETRFSDCPTINGYRPPGFCRCEKSMRHPITGACFSGNETLIPIYIASTDGRNPTSLESADYVNICAPDSSLDGLPHGAVGIAGFGRTNLVSLPARLACDISLPWLVGNPARNPSLYNRFALIVSFKYYKCTRCGLFWCQPLLLPPVISS